VLPRAETNDALERALLIYGALEHNWRSLYMVLEAIEDGNGGEKGLIAKNFVPQGEIKKFKGTANSYRAIRLDARHGSTSTGSPAARTGLMEARALIRNLLDVLMNELIQGTHLLEEKIRTGGKSWGEALLEVAGTVEGLPPDYAENHDHYLHGLPRR
jgi:hypothetical protein